MPDLIRIVLVDDHPLFREGVAHTLNAASGFEVVGQGASADEALQLARDLLPDLILLDVDMPGDGISVVPAIGAACPVTKIVMLTVSAADDDVLRALKAGAHGYVLKGVSSRELHLTEKTVKHYMTNILQKLQVRNRVEASILARKFIGQQGE